LWTLLTAAVAAYALAKVGFWPVARLTCFFAKLDIWWYSGKKVHGVCWAGGFAGGATGAGAEICYRACFKVPFCKIFY